MPISTPPALARSKGGADAQGLGRSRGGLSTKIHAATEAPGLPVRLIASPGQRNDIAFAHDLIDGINAEAAIADKGYDANHLAGRIAEAGTEVVIPPKRNRRVQRDYDADLYKERNRIERFFNKLKQLVACSARDGSRSGAWTTARSSCGWPGLPLAAFGPPEPP